MMKNLIILILINSYSLIAQEYDVRKTRWGTSINEVLYSEYPLTPDKSDESELEYKDVELSNGHKATILYKFKNRKLIEVKYLMYGYDASFSKGTCKNIISLFNKVHYTSFVFDTLQAKGFKCNMGWYLVNCSTVFPVGKDNCKLDKITIERIEKAAADLKCESIGLNYQNKRTDVIFYFNQYQNTFTNNSEYNLPCDSSFYNTYYWLKFTPSYELERELKKSDF
jgi:hypothetical protein|nr:hypothetical protein [uncultured Flavobacterium sp.]